MTETIDTIDLSPDISARQSCLEQAADIYLCEEYADTAIELITAANNGKYDKTKTIAANLNMAAVALVREEFSQDLYRQMAPAL